MSGAHRLHCYDYVNHPYAAVRDAIDEAGYDVA